MDNILNVEKWWKSLRKSQWESCEKKCGKVLRRRNIVEKRRFTHSLKKFYMEFYTGVLSLKEAKFSMISTEPITTTTNNLIERI